jgi:predicted nucleic acid-binding Zn ribbon protein
VNNSAAAPMRGNGAKIRTPSSCAQVVKAEKTQKKGRMMMCIMLLIALVVFMLIFVAIEKIIF